VIKPRSILERLRQQIRLRTRLQAAQDKIAETYLTRRAIRRIRAQFSSSTLIGPYERAGQPLGIHEEQWLWANRALISGDVLDMSTPRYWHAYVYELPTVRRVQISDLCATEIDKGGYKSPVDIVADFCAADLPVPERSFDTVLCISILEHCADPQALVNNIQRVLRPGGFAFFFCPFAYIDGHMGELCPDYWRFGRDGYRLLAQRGGLEVVRIDSFNDIGDLFRGRFGQSLAATSWHRGIPVSNAMICRRS
jgi:SAM-dependent methyltransferase